MNKKNQAIIQISLSILCLILVVVECLFMGRKVEGLEGVLIGAVCVCIIIQLVAYKNNKSYKK